MFFPLLAMLFVPQSVGNTISLKHAIPNTVKVARYAKFQLTLDLKTSAANPFDPDEIDVEAAFLSPTGKHIDVPGFLYQPYTSHLNNNAEQLTPDGPPVWMVRFSPDAPGLWKYVVSAHDATGSVTLPAKPFLCIRSLNRGFVRKDTRDPARFIYSDGKPYFPVGENMCWAGQKGTYDFAQWLQGLSGGGGDWIRLWISTFNGIEWAGLPPVSGPDEFDGYHGMGYYNLQKAWYIDRIMDLAEEDHVNVMLCIGTYSEFTSGGFFGEGQWPQNPYNAANGGPCKTPADFWNNPDAQKLYRHRLRYLIARYGWRSNLFGWEFWNEANPTADWMSLMSSYMKGLNSYSGHPADPYDHLLSTTYGKPAIWTLPGVDFTMSHNYGTGNIADWAPVVLDDAKVNIKFLKPHFMAEFGIDWRKSDTPYDPDGKGVNLHNALWASVVSGDAATAMIWYWDGYIAPMNLYHIFQPVRKFTDAVPWRQGKWKSMMCDAPIIKGSRTENSNLHLIPENGWGKSASSNFTITPSGHVEGGALPTFLYSPSKPDLRMTPVFHVHYQQAGKFILSINQVSNFAKLNILLDGKQAASISLSAAPPKDSGKPLYKSTKFETEYGIYLADFDSELSIDVPEGRHTISLDLQNGDWMTIGSITLTNYRDGRYPALRCSALTDGKMAILWVQNEASNWMNVYKKIPIHAIPPAATTLHGLPDGRYKVVWFNTRTGGETGQQYVESKMGRIPLPIPEIRNDIVCWIKPVNGR